MVFSNWTLVQNFTHVPLYKYVDDSRLFEMCNTNITSWSGPANPSLRLRPWHITGRNGES